MCIQVSTYSEDFYRANDYGQLQHSCKGQIMTLIRCWPKQRPILTPLHFILFLQNVHDKKCSFLAIVSTAMLAHEISTSDGWMRFPQSLKAIGFEWAATATFPCKLYLRDNQQLVISLCMLAWVSTIVEEETRSYIRRFQWCMFCRHRRWQLEGNVFSCCLWQWYPIPDPFRAMVNWICIRSFCLHWQDVCQTSRLHWGGRQVWRQCSQANTFVLQICLNVPIPK